MVRHYYVQNVKDGIQFRAYKANKERVTHSSPFPSVEVKKISKKSQDQFRELLRKLRFRQNDGFLIKTRVL